MSVPRHHTPDAAHRHPTDARTGPPPARQPPRLRSQAVAVAAVPALVWALANPAAALAAAALAAVAALSGAAVALARVRRHRRPAAAAE